MFFNTPVYNRDDVLPLFEEKFLRIQSAVNSNSVNVLQNECTQEMFDFLMDNKAQNIRNGLTNIVENVKVQNMYTIDAFNDEDLGQDFHTVRIQFWMSDYYVDGNNVLVEGSVAPQYFEETWVFTRVEGSTLWFLASIELD